MLLNAKATLTDGDSPAGRASLAQLEAALRER
jgi:hypothetical protein